jgi:parvulin-like peptidyl-prolyl isomerase
MVEKAHSKDSHESKHEHTIEHQHNVHAKHDSKHDSKHEHANTGVEPASEKKPKEFKIGALEYVLGAFALVVILGLVLAIPYLMAKTNDSVFATIELEGKSYELTNAEIDGYLQILASNDQRLFLAENLVLLHIFNLKADTLGIPKVTPQMQEYLLQHEQELDAGLSDPQLQPILKERGISAEDFKQKSLQYAALSLRANEVLRMEIIPEDMVDDAALLEFYTENIDLFTTEEQVDASHILICHTGSMRCSANYTKAESLAVISELRTNIVSNSITFEQAAKEYGSDGTKDVGGSLGTFGRGAMVKEFEDATFALNVGEISQPVETAFGYHLIRVNQKIPAQTMPFDPMTVEQIYFQNVLIPMQEQYVIELQSLAKITYAAEEN